jgi:predicted small metal-binding protein
MPAKKQEMTTMKKEAWSVTCGDAGINDCGFFVREHDAKRMVKFVRQHLKEAHKMDADEKTIMGLAKTAKW